RNSGRSKIIHITGPRDYQAARIRAAEYQRQCGSGSDVLFGEWSEEWGHEAVRKVMSRNGVTPDAIFCGSDEIARGVIDALRDLEISVPDEIAVVGFDNWEVVSKQTRPPLTTVDMQLKELGHQVGMAMLAISHGDPIAPGIVKLPCRLVRRHSS
ncbi:substrate-binding domain-containing protein, partial [Agrobacterium sp.]